MVVFPNLSHALPAGMWLVAALVFGAQGAATAKPVASSPSPLGPLAQGPHPNRPTPQAIQNLQARVRPASQFSSGGSPARAQAEQLIFCHGYGGSPKDSLLPDLVRRFRAQKVAVQIAAPWTEPKVPRGANPAQGYRRLGPTTLTFALAQIDALARRSLRKVSLIGHSFGGLSALIYSAQHPGKVKRLVVIAPAVGIVGALKKELGIHVCGQTATAKALRRRLQSARRRLASVQRHHQPYDVAQISEQINWLTMGLDIHTYGEAQWLKQLKVPTLVIRADQDVLVSPARVNRVEAASPLHVQTLVLSSAGHMLDAPTPAETTLVLGRVAGRIGSFLKL